MFSITSSLWKSTEARDRVGTVLSFKGKWWDGLEEVTVSLEGRREGERDGQQTQVQCSDGEATKGDVGKDWMWPQQQCTEKGHKCGPIWFGVQWFLLSTWNGPRSRTPLGLPGFMMGFSQRSSYRESTSSSASLLTLLDPVRCALMRSVAANPACVKYITVAYFLVRNWN